MTDQTPPIAPLAKTLFGWAFAQKRVAPIAIALGAIGALLIADELVRGRAGLNLPYEETPGFYGALGFGVVAVTLLVAHLFRLVLTRLPSPDDDRP